MRKSKCTKQGFVTIVIETHKEKEQLVLIIPDDVLKALLPNYTAMTQKHISDDGPLLADNLEVTYELETKTCHQNDQALATNMHVYILHFYNINLH